MTEALNQARVRYSSSAETKCQPDNPSLTYLLGRSPLKNLSLTLLPRPPLQCMHVFQGVGGLGGRPRLTHPALVGALSFGWRVSWELLLLRPLAAVRAAAPAYFADEPDMWA